MRDPFSQLLCLSPMRLFFVTLILRLFAWLPLAINHALGSMIGSILYMLNGRERRTTERNLELCFPEKTAQERTRIAKQSLQETAKWAFETGAVWFRGEQWRESKITRFVNKELFEQAMADERGILLIMPHFGNWELAGIYAGDQTKGTCIYRTPKMEDLDPLVKKARSASKLSTLVPATARGVMAVLKALKRGELTVILPDQVPTGDGGIYSNFFGVSTYTQTLVYNLIQKTNPIVLQIYTRRISGGFELGFMEPDASIYDEDPQKSVDALNASIEDLCRLDLAQYQWEYKRFKNQADGIDLYS